MTTTPIRVCSRNAWSTAGAGVRRAGPRLALLLALAGLATGCAPQGRGAPGGPGPHYTLNALDGTLTPLDVERLAPAGPPLPAGAAPAQAASGAGGSVLVLSFTRDRPGGLTRVGPERGAWRARPVALETPLHQATLAADGERYAVVAHHLPERPPPPGGRPEPAPGPETREGRCRLTLLDLTTGETRALATHTVCAPGERVAGVALGSGTDGPVAYLGVWDARGPQDDPGPPRAPASPGAPVPRGLRDRVVALDARSGTVLAVRALASAPEHLQLRPAGQERPEGRLYVLEGAPGAESDYSTQGRWRLLGLHPATLETEQEAFLGGQARALTVAPGGRHAYALAAGGKDVLHVDLTTGVTHRVGALPGHAAGTMAVTEGHVLVPNPLGQEVWALDRRDGRLAATIPVGRRPIAVVPGGRPG